LLLYAANIAANAGQGKPRDSAASERAVGGRSSAQPSFATEVQLRSAQVLQCDRSEWIE
jgi:hypothetical protein